MILELFKQKDSFSRQMRLTGAHQKWPTQRLYINLALLGRQRLVNGT
jgi:hypothetical protein